MAIITLAETGCSTKIELFCRMRDFICKRNGTYDYSATGIGWSLYDSSYATDEDNPEINDWYVIKSIGESGNEDMYFKVTWVSGDLKIQGYMYWNNSTHVGVHVYNTANNFMIEETGSYGLYITGDLNAILAFETLDHASHDYCVLFGMLDNMPEDNTAAISSSAITAATPATITLDAVPSSWEVGKKIYIRDTANVDIIEILSIAGNDITANTTRDYLIGCKLQADIGYFCNNSATAFALITMVGRSNTSPIYNTYVYAYLAANADPDELTQKHTCIPWHCVSATGYFGTYPLVNFSTYTGLTVGDTFVGSDGNNYRYMKYYNNFYMMVLEA